MKIKPEIILAEKVFYEYQKILITGSDESYMSYLLDFFINKYKSKKFYVDYRESFEQNRSGNLFSYSKTLHLLKNSSLKNLSEEVLKNEEVYMLVSSTSRSNVGKIKSKFINSKKNLFVECFPLTKKSKEFVLKNYFQENSIIVSSEVFWYIIENFEKNYVLLINQLNLLNLYKKEYTKISEVDEVVFNNTESEINKIFFEIFKNNKIIIKTFKNTISSQGDFYLLLNSIKNYINILAFSQNLDSALLKFPKYLFEEKETFIKIFNSLNDIKVKKIFRNIFKVEKTIRKCPSIYSQVGLRFLINTKKIIVS